MNLISEMENSIIRLVYIAGGWKILARNGNIFVLEGKNRIEMRCGYSTIYSILDKRSIFTHSYFDYFLPLAYTHENPKILVIGMGGGTIPLQLIRLLKNRMSLEVVDVNGEILKLASKYFLKGESIRTVMDDGARYVSTKKGEFDLIILDAFDGPNIPKQFMGEEFVKNASNALSDNGILGINVDISNSRTNDYIKILGRQFRMYRLRPSLTSTNLVLICSKKFDKTYIANAANKIREIEGSEFLIRRYSALQ